jgi:hypothetical protein
VRPPVSVTRVTSDGTWYEAEWTITVHRGGGPLASRIKASDLPEDIRGGLTDWLSGDE